MKTIKWEEATIDSPGIYRLLIPENGLSDPLDVDVYNPFGGIVAGHGNTPTYDNGNTDIFCAEIPDEKVLTEERLLDIFGGPGLNDAELIAARKIVSDVISKAYDLEVGSDEFDIVCESILKGRETYQTEYLYKDDLAEIFKCPSHDIFVEFYSLRGEIARALACLAVDIEGGEYLVLSGAKLKKVVE